MGEGDGRLKVNWYRLVGLNLLNMAITVITGIEKTLLTSTVLGVAMVLLALEKEMEK